MLKRRERKGVAVVEFAVCLPILVLLVLGINEVCAALYLKEQVTVAAYEGSRIGCQRGTTDLMVEDYVKAMLDERGISYDASKVVTFSNPGFSSARTMEHVTTTVTVPMGNNSITGSVFTGDQEITASVTMRKEFEN